jgi:glycosyltransferase involved in cell wall biosynthesis
VFVVLGALFVDFANGYGRLRWLGELPASGAPETHWPTLSIIAPARNEARGIEAAVASLLRLDYPGLEIVIVNDRSTDETAAILERLEREHNTVRLKQAEIRLRHTALAGPKTELNDVQTVAERINVDAGYVGADTALKVVTVAQLPAGWLGKNHAMHVGAASATGELLLFTDADIVFKPSTMRRAVSYLEARRIDHLAAIPDVRVRGFALNAFVAAFGVFFSIYSRPWHARNPRSRAHVGIGAFNLIRADVYRAIGGHQPIAMRPDDDLKLGKLVKKRGFRQDAVIGRDFVMVEWYASLRELVDGLMKNTFAGVEYSVPAVVGSTAALLVVNVWPVIAVFLTGGVTQLLYAFCVIFIVLLFWIVNRRQLGYVIVYPAAALLFAYIMWRSAFLAVSRGTIGWRGTEYQLDAMKKNRV